MHVKHSGLSFIDPRTCHQEHCLVPSSNVAARLTGDPRPIMPRKYQNQESVDTITSNSLNLTPRDEGELADTTISIQAMQAAKGRIIPHQGTIVNGMPPNVAVDARYPNAATILTALLQQTPAWPQELQAFGGTARCAELCESQSAVLASFQCTHEHHCWLGYQWHLSCIIELHMPPPAKLHVDHLADSMEHML